MGAALTALAAYAVALFRLPGWRPAHVAAFYGGVGAVVVALSSPLHALGECCSLSAHMVQHQLLLFVAPPLLLWGLSGMVLGAGRGASVGPRWAGPYLTAGLMVITIYAWHWPAFYQSAMQSDALHEAEHLSFLLTGLLFWWRLFAADSPGVAVPPWHWSRIPYLFGGMLAMMPLGLILMVAPAPLFPLYASAQSAAGLSLASREMAALADQQLAGLYMLSGGGTVLAAALAGALLLPARRLPTAT